MPSKGDIREIFDQVPKSALQINEINNALQQEFFIEALVMIDQSLELVAEAHLGRKLIDHGFKPRKPANYGGVKIELLPNAREARHRIVVSLLFDLTLIKPHQKEIFDRVRDTRNKSVHNFHHSSLDPRKARKAVMDGLRLLNELEALGAIDPND